MGVALISALILCALLIASKASAILGPSALVYAAVILVSIATLLRDFIWKFYKRQFKPRAYHIVQEMRAVQNRRDKRKQKNGKMSNSLSIDSETDLLTAR